VPIDASLTTPLPERFVSRGGYKLEAALAHFEVAPRDWVCVDIGASTGGFTDCLLQHGAARVYAYDVGHSQLDWKIRSDPRVVVREKLNARQLVAADLPEPTRLGVVDVSFISLRLILPPLAAALAASLAGANDSGGVILALIKPQFELARGEVGKGGIVREPELHSKAVAGIAEFVRLHLSQWRWTGVIESPILGATGNKEFLACLKS
jgi:23S rRNA (cytidine1920-2'-O)/16S rRNA (cytidine1409-2'-O)-methyltransferase